MKEGKKGGVDGIETAMLKRLGRTAKERWLSIFNKSWEEGVCPDTVEEGHHHTNFEDRKGPEGEG